MSEIRDKMSELLEYMNSKIIGQEDLNRKLLITLLADGHALVEGAPGLAKTKAIKTLSSLISARYNRIQFTPDLLPSDIVGSDIYVASKGEFEFRPGPVFANLVLADEINRAPAKVQSALLGAMAARQVSVGGKRYVLPELFMVMATQNPIEHEGTYNLPEAQLDRFLMYIRIDQPEAEAERKILFRALNKLSGREKMIVRMRFGLDHPEGKEMTQKEVADLLGISQSYISRLEKKIMTRLRREMIRYE